MTDSIASIIRRQIDSLDEIPDNLNKKAEEIAISACKEYEIPDTKAIIPGARAYMRFKFSDGFRKSINRGFQRDE